VRKYFELLKSQAKVDAAYSAWFWAGTFSTILKLLILYFFWQAVYENRTSLGGLPLDSMLTYMVIAALLGNLHFFGPGATLAENIRNGEVAVELLRPYDLLNKLVAMNCGGFGMYLLREMLPMMALAVLFLDIHLPATFLGGVLFVLSTGIGLFLAMYIDLVVGVLAFWTVNIFGLRVLKNAVMMFFTGSLVPITLFPGWLQTLSQYLPFQSVVYVPVSIYTGTLSGADAFVAIGVQVLWLAALVVLVRAVWNAAVRKVTVFGG
jgi:ABC-2 type transport system permease protein